MNNKTKTVYPYKMDGYELSGTKIPDIPILYLCVEKPNGKKISGPAIIDTGFDGSLFANDTLTFFLSDVPKESDRVVGGFGTIEFTCELFKLQAYLLDTTKKIVQKLGNTTIFVPIELNYLSEYVIIGRELLNTISFCLNGKQTTLIELLE